MGKHVGEPLSYLNIESLEKEVGNGGGEPESFKKKNRSQSACFEKKEGGVGPKRPFGRTLQLY